MGLYPQNAVSRDGFERMCPHLTPSLAVARGAHLSSTGGIIPAVVVAGPAVTSHPGTGSSLMPQTAIPFLFMRGGTSRGPYFNRRDLPEDLSDLSRVLVSALGSGHAINIDGIGGGTAVTTKVAMLSRSDDEWAEVDYFFAQVTVQSGQVDYEPSCGNMLTGVGPAAIEMGLVDAQPDTTDVRIRAVNTGARIESVVQTPCGQVEYEGDASINGVPGTAAPVLMKFMDVVGSKTGALFPSGASAEVIDDIAVSCVDVAMPMVMARAESFGLTGAETPEELDANEPLMQRLEKIRLQAGQRMGLGDVSQSVIPKIGLLSAPAAGGTIRARYFMPWNCHPSMAVTGSQCVAACALSPNTVACELACTTPDSSRVCIEHPSGTIELDVDYDCSDGDLCLHSAGLTRTARLLARGELMVPGSIWDGKAYSGSFVR
jgi:2-methylaconitate cis-trans-isomerase PrpF